MRRGVAMLAAVWVLSSAGAAAAQDEPTAGQVLAEALARAHETGAIDRLFAERHYLGRKEWVAVDGGRPQRAAEALIKVRAFQGEEGFELEVLTWTPTAVQPRRFSCALAQTGLVFWGEQSSTWRQIPRTAGPRWPALFLPQELVEWVVPLLWDQGLPSELLFSESPQLAVRPEAQALIRITPPRPGGERAKVTIADASTERSFEVAVGGPEDGRLLEMRAVELYVSQDQELRQEEIRESISAQDFLELRKAWREAFLETHVELRLRDGETGEPVLGATATLEAFEGGAGQTAVSGELGRVYLAHAGVEGTYRLSLKVPRYHSFVCQGRSSPLAREVTHHDGRRGFQPERLVLELTRAQLGAGLDVELWHGLWVRGQVFSPGGKPVARATVRFDLRDEGGGEGPRRLVRTDGDGRFGFETVPGRLSLVVGHSRWQTELLELDASAGIEPLQITLAAGGEVQGRVLDREGRPLAGALVEALVPGAELDPPGLYDPSWGGRRVRDTTDDLGRYLLRGVRPGKLVLRASRLGYRPLVNDQLEAAVGRTERRRILLNPGGGVAGRFVDAEGQPVVLDGTVTYRQVGAEWSISVALANQSTFLVEDPTIADYECVLELTGYRRVELGPTPAGTHGLVVVVEPDAAEGSR